MPPRIIEPPPGQEKEWSFPKTSSRMCARRLHRVVGQVQGVERMLDEGRECRDVVTQISAATKALEQAGFRLVAAGLTYCLRTSRGRRG